MKMNKKGFTLIELMVVIAIIIILAAIAIPNYINMTKRAQASRATSDAAVLATALEVYKTDNGTYPVAGTVLLPDVLAADASDDLGVALATNDKYVSTATIAQIVGSEKAAGIEYVSVTGASWSLKITTPDGQVGTRTSDASVMSW